MRLKIILSAFIVALAALAILNFKNKNISNSKDISENNPPIHEIQETEKAKTQTFETANWNVYADPVFNFSLRYPTGWRFSRAADGKETRIEFSPAAAAPQEAETDPKIILRIFPLATGRGQYGSTDQWFEKEIIGAKIGVFDAGKTVRNGDTIYFWSEGLAEYPHENIITVHGENEFWFVVEASDEATRKNLKLMSETFILSSNL